MKYDIPATDGVQMATSLSIGTEMRIPEKISRLTLFYLEFLCRALLNWFDQVASGGGSSHLVLKVRREVLADLLQVVGHVAGTDRSDAMEKGYGMNTVMMVEQGVDVEGDVDLIDEIRLRTWARKHYAPVSERDDNWHPVVLDEMIRKDAEV